MDEQIKQQLIEAAILAPSADNSQPWLYEWHNGYLDLWVDESRSEGFSDQRYVLSDLAIGACIENIVIRAHSLGYTTQIAYLPNPEQTPLWAARLTFPPAPAQDETLVHAISERHTDRSFPWRGPVTTTIKQTLSAEAEKLHGAKLTWLDGTPHYKTALKAMWLAESLRFGNKDLHQELFSSICFNVGNSATCAEGLAPVTLAIEPPLRPVFKVLRRWTVMKILNCIGGNYLIGFRSAMLPTLLSPALGVIGIQQTSRTDIISAGRALQRTWLMATKMGFTIQPFAAAGILTLGHIKIAHSHSQHQLKKIKDLVDMVMPGNRGLIFFRMGKKGGTQIQHSSRRATTTFKRPA